MMRKFYRLLDDLYILGRWHLDDPMIDEGCEHWEFTMGRVVRPGLMPIVDVKIPGVPLDYTPTLLSVPTASPRLVSAIAPLYGDDVQRIPIRLANREGYEIINVIQLLPCLDEAKSEFTKWTEQDRRPDLLGGYHSVPRLRVDVSLIPEDVNFLRVWGWEVALLVSEAVVDAFKRINATGAIFEPTFDG